jgi:sirohydrochlorin ferrochelatase
MHVAFEPGGFPRDVGLLLVGHGSREAFGRVEFLAVARRVAALAGDCAVEPCFLEFAAPSIAAGFQALAQRGKRRIVVVPVLLFSAGHAQRDIPAAVAAAAAEHSGIAVEQCRHLGCHEAILALSRQRFDEATAHLQPAIDRTALVMVGRGSHDAEATAEMRRFVELRAADTPWHRVFTSFVTMAEPSYVDALAEAADCGRASSCSRTCCSAACWSIASVRPSLISRDAIPSPSGSARRTWGRRNSWPRRFSPARPRRYQTWLRRLAIRRIVRTAPVATTIFSGRAARSTDQEKRTPPGRAFAPRPSRRAAESAICGATQVPAHRVPTH